MPKSLDCIVCGSCVVDILVRPVSLSDPIGGGNLIRVEPIEVARGGIVSNSGTAMARLGMKAGAFSCVGDDDWGKMIRRMYDDEGIDTSNLMTHPTAATSTTAVLIDQSGERSFAHCVGAPKLLKKQVFIDHLDYFASARIALMGYYSLMPNLESDLADVMAQIRSVGCKTALDAAGDGGTMNPLTQILPHLDIYVPSHNEAEHQTGEHDPQRIIERFRECGAPGVLGVKLGSQGVLLSGKKDEYTQIPAADPPGDVVDTTGAGDSFYAGLLAGLIKGMDLHDAGRLGVATGACCVTAVGATTGLRGYNETAQLVGLPTN